MLTHEQLQAIRERCQAATPGPWEAQGCAVSGPFTTSGRPFLGVHCAAPQGTRDNSRQRADAAFIAGARTDVPLLLLHIEEQATEIERLRRQQS